MKDEAWQRITNSVHAVGRSMRSVDEVKGNKIINTCIPSSNNVSLLKLFKMADDAQNIPILSRHSIPYSLFVISKLSARRSIQTTSNQLFVYIVRQA